MVLKSAVSYQNNELRLKLSSELEDTFEVIYPLTLVSARDDMYSKRMKLNMKIMGQPRPENKKTFREKFVPPELSMITYFMTKPFVENNDSVFGYDSDDCMSSSNEDDDEDEDSDTEIDQDLNRPTSL